MTTKTFHVVIRFSDTIFAVGNVVELHNAVIEEHGSVWFGKMGQTISKNRVDLLNEQVEKKIPTFLYLVKGNRRKSTAYRALLMNMQKEKPQDGAFIPHYYIEKGIIQ